MAETEVTLQQIIDGDAALNEIVGLGRNEIDSIAVIGFQAYEQGRVEEAETVFEGLSALDGNLYYGPAGLGAIRLSQGRLDEAEEFLQEALKRNPDDPTVRANLGETILRQGRLGEAAEQFQKALELDPEMRDGGVNRARAILQGMEVVLAAIENAGGGSA